VELWIAAGRFPGEVILSMWPIVVNWSEDLACVVCRAAGLMPIDGGGNLISLGGRGGAI
jgi:hypothetical protein